MNAGKFPSRKSFETAMMASEATVRGRARRAGVGREVAGLIIALAELPATAAGTVRAGAAPELLVEGELIRLR